MISDAQLDAWFTYHPPTEEQKPRYAAIREAELAAVVLPLALANFVLARGGAVPEHDAVNAAFRHCVEVIDAFTPDSADKSAAIRCVRLARMAMNEGIVHAKRMATLTMVGNEMQFVAGCADYAAVQLREARWQASAAIALEGRP